MSDRKAEYMKKYRRSLKGVVSAIYSQQKASSIKRNHDFPSYSKKELENWFIKQHNFEKLWKAWEESGYCKSSKPSVDRIDNKIGYTMQNIQLMSWRENDKKGRIEVSGKDNFNYKPKSHYENSSTSRGDFKTRCRRQGWDFNNFEEIDSKEKNSSNNKKFYYKEVNK